MASTGGRRGSPLRRGLTAISVLLTTLPATAEVEVRNGFFREIALDHPASGPALVAVDEEDTVWVALARAGKLARYLNGAVETFELGPNSRPVGLAAGSVANGFPGSLWIAASFDNKIIRFDVADGGTQEFPLGSGEEASWPFNIAIGPRGKIWFSQRAGGRIGRLDPESGEILHFELPTPYSGPAGLAVDPASGAVWYGAGYADRIGRLDPETGEVREYVMGESSSGLESGPAGLALDASGGVWFAKLEGKLGHLAPGAETLELIDLPAQAKRPAGIAVSRQGEVWVLALDGNLLLSHQPGSGDFVLYPLPTGSADGKPRIPPFARTARPFGVALDRQGNVWFSEQYTGQLGVLDVAAPQVRLVSPRGEVSAVEVLMTHRVTDRISGVAGIRVTLDGRPADLAQGRLDLTRLRPGRHALRLTAFDAAGFQAYDEVELDFAPGPLALMQLLERLEPRGETGRVVRSQLLDMSRRMSRDGVSRTLEALRRRLEGETASFEPTAAWEALRRTLRFQLSGGPRTLEVQLVDDEPFFVPRQLRIRPGDTVSWVYDPPLRGHSLSQRLQRIEIELDRDRPRSSLLRAGESFSYRFDRAGRFTVRNTEQPQARSLVEVVRP